MITAAELAAIRKQIAETHTQNAILLRKTTVSDGRGGRSVSWTNHKTFKCRFSTVPPARNQVMELGGVVSEQAYTISAAWDLDINATDRVQIESIEYEVIGVHDRGNWDTHTRVTLRRIV